MQTEEVEVNVLAYSALLLSLVCLSLKARQCIDCSVCVFFAFQLVPDFVFNIIECNKRQQETVFIKHSSEEITVSHVNMFRYTFTK